MTRGIDLCYHQGDIDWNKVKASGIDFIIPRDGWGTSDIDPKFVEYVKGAQNAKIDVPAVYHFIYAVDTHEAIQNAATAINNVRRAGLPPSTIIWCDQEEDTVIKARHRGYNLSADDQTHITQAFCDYILEQGYCTGVYLNKDYIQRVYGKTIIDQYDIWYAWLKDNPEYPCLYQQDNWHGHVDGISVEVDTDLYIGTYTAGTAKPKGDDKDLSHIVYTEKQLTDILRTLGSGNPPSSYSNDYPKNLLYWDGSRWWADCVNLYKALFNGRSIVNPAPGSYQQDLSNTGDVTEWGLMKLCTDRSVDFTKLGNQFRCLYMEGHFGGYMGFEWNEPGQGIVNCVESTPRWEDGIQYSYVDENGGRRWAKDKPVEGQWECHGLATPWIDYSGSQPQPAPEPIHKEMTKDLFASYLPVIVKGSDNDGVALLQKCLKYTGDYTGVIDGDAGPMTDAAIRQYQKRHGLDVDGSCGPKTWSTIIGN